MSDASKPEAAAAAPPPKRSGGGMLTLVLPALIAGGAAFGGAKVAGAHAGHAAPANEHVVIPAKPPGPTVALDPFLVQVADATKKVHPMKVTLAIECDPSVKEEQLKSFQPRMRDATLSYLRTISYEDATDPKTDKIREDLIEKLHRAGATFADRILVTDLVIQ